MKKGNDIYDDVRLVIEKKVYSQNDFTNYLLNNEGEFELIIPQLKISEFKGFDEIGAGVEEEAEVANNSSRMLLKQNKNDGKWFIDFDLGLGL